MSRVTSKLQVTLPKAIADRYGVVPGAELTFEPAGESIRVLVAREPSTAAVAETGLALDERKALLEAAARRQDQRNRRYRLKVGATAARKTQGTEARGWSREELYGRARAR